MFHDAPDRDFFNLAIFSLDALSATGLGRNPTISEDLLLNEGETAQMGLAPAAFEVAFITAW